MDIIILNCLLFYVDIYSFWYFSINRNIVVLAALFLYVLFSGLKMVRLPADYEDQTSSEKWWNPFQCVHSVCMCVCVWCALAWRGVCQTVGLFSSVSLCPLGPLTGERFTSYLYLAENGVCVCVCGGQVGFSEPVEWSRCWQQAGNWKRGKKKIEDSAAVRHFCSDESLAEKIQNKWN